MTAARQSAPRLVRRREARNKRCKEKDWRSCQVFGRPAFMSKCVEITRTVGGIISPCTRRFSFCSWLLAAVFSIIPFFVLTQKLSSSGGIRMGQRDISLFGVGDLDVAGLVALLQVSFVVLQHLCWSSVCKSSRCTRRCYFTWVWFARHRERDKFDRFHLFIPALYVFRRPDCYTKPTKWLSGYCSILVNTSTITVFIFFVGVSIFHMIHTI